MEKDIWKKKEIIFGNIDFNNKGKNRNLVTIDMKLHNQKEGLVLSICGNVWNHNHNYESQTKTIKPFHNNNISVEFVYSLLTALNTYLKLSSLKLPPVKQ